MRKKILLLISIILILICNSGFSAGEFRSAVNDLNYPDSIDKEIVYNGRAWRNLYGRVQGNQFLFSGEFLPGTVTIENKRFEVPKLKYDIYNDELLIVNDKGIILQLSRENTDRFSLDYLNKNYQFKRLNSDSINSLSGYVNVLYEGNTSLYVKYRKNILLLAVDNKYDIFDQVQKIYLQKGTEIFPVSSRRSFLNLLKDQKQQVRNFIKTNRIKLSKLNPESFIPVVNYYDKLLH